MTVVLNYYVASFYDSILLYALSINETLALNHSIGKDNIDELAGKYWNRTFPGNKIDAGSRGLRASL